MSAARVDVTRRAGAATVAEITRAELELASLLEWSEAAHAADVRHESLSCLVCFCARG